MGEPPDRRLPFDIRRAARQHIEPQAHGRSRGAARATITDRGNSGSSQSLRRISPACPAPSNPISPIPSSLLSTNADAPPSASRRTAVRRLQGKGRIAKGNEGQVRANREKALFSHIWNFARERGLTAKPNPCAGMRGFRETGRDTYVDDETYQAVWTGADEPTRHAMELANLTGQRPADVLKLTWADVREGAVAGTCL